MAHYQIKRTRLLLQKAKKKDMYFKLHWLSKHGDHWQRVVSTVCLVYCWSVIRLLWEFLSYRKTVKLLSDYTIHLTYSTSCEVVPINIHRSCCGTRDPEQYWLGTEAVAGVIATKTSRFSSSLIIRRQFWKALSTAVLINRNNNFQDTLLTLLCS